jgi:phenylpropionate dioxygenase-like ring-hydroxylating dioxygenase large terminal subunit
MLVTKQPVLRRFWYPVMPLAKLAGGPQPFTLLGEAIVVWLRSDGTPAAVRDRCCHRTAKLSKGCVAGDNIQCGYHGWEYDASGACVKIPQAPESAIPSGARVPAYRAQGRYGYAWVALDEPLADIFPIPEHNDAAYRCVQQFDEQWKTSPLRLMENSFDAAHFAFVHRGTFGQFNKQKPEFFALTETDYGFEAETKLVINNPAASHRITGTTAPTTRRHFRNQWHLPFNRRLGLNYPNGLEHLIVTCATPIDDEHIQVLQWLYRNDSEADCSAAELNEWDARVIAEDKVILETVDYDAPVDVSRQAERSMPSDQPGLIMRKRLLALLREHGEQEVHVLATA